MVLSATKSTYSVRRMHISSNLLRTVTLVALVGLNSIAAGQTAPRADRAAPERASAGAAAMANTITIERDTFGVPHVYGPTDAACVFGFMYAQAEDYFWQIEDSYVRSVGRAAEIYGEKSLPDDLVNRALEITRLSKDELRTASPKNKEICQATADGLNYYLAVNPQVKPRLITHFEPWHPLAFRRFILYQSFIYGKSGLSATDILSAVNEVHGDKVSAVAFPPGLRAELAELTRDRQSMSEHIGSNMWAIRPEKSTSGKALMFINPHQPFFGPGQWYEGHLVSGEGWNLLGACFFGSPFPSLGYNGHVAWSHTVNNPDIVDLYTITFDDKSDPLKYRWGDRSRQAIVWTDDVIVKGENALNTRRFRFTRTHHGPLVAVRDGKPLAIRLAKLEDNGAIDQAHAMGRRIAWLNSRKPCGRVTCRCLTPLSPTPAATFSTCTTARCRSDRRNSIGQNRSMARILKQTGRATSGLTSFRNCKTPDAVSCRTAINHRCAQRP